MQMMKNVILNMVSKRSHESTYDLADYHKKQDTMDVMESMEDVQDTKIMLLILLIIHATFYFLNLTM